MSGTQSAFELPGVLTVERDERDPQDRYYTPRWCVDLVLGHDDPRISIAIATGASQGVLEPSAGGGALLRGLARHFATKRWRPPPRVVAVDLDPDPRPGVELGFADVTWRQGDFLDAHATPLGPREFGLALLNPPFSRAEEFVRRCREVSRWTLALLRLTFLESQARAAWLERDPPDVFVLSRRPLFDGSGHTDQVTSAWMLWGPGRPGCGVGRLKVLP